jgi:peptidoglycan/LPS O-acetylase OafA/YrhL
MGFRADLEGLRGIAVTLVVLFHAGLLGVVGGFVGVDAFYVISGFLISGLLARELSATGRLDLAAFYGRRARRILPAATVAIVVILASAAFIVAPLDLGSIAIDASASGLFVGNLVFAFRATDYFGATAPSPFLHYWSLGVEEQFYLVWPVLLLVAFRLRRPRLITFAILLGSFALCVWLTPTQPPWAFYMLPTRAWQLALGALLALNASVLVRVPSAVAALGGWIGLGLLTLAAMVLEPTIGYPGIAALVPSVGVALLIASGTHRLGPGRLVAISPLRALGRISFSLYLYHWPLLVLAGIALGALSPLTRWSLVAVAVVIAYLSWRFVEQPFLLARRGRQAPRRSLVLAAGMICMVLVSSQIVGLFGASSLAASSPVDVPAGIDAAPTVVTTASPTASPARSMPQVVSPTIAATPSSPPRTLAPTIAAARTDVDGLNERGCGLSLAGSRPPLCELGDTDGGVTVALVGDSHAAQWFPALEVIANQRGWKILPFTKDSCIFVDARIISLHLQREYTECAAWREQVIAAVQHAQPDLVVVSSSRWVHPVNIGDADAQVQADAMVRLLKRLPGRVAIIADTPLNDQDIPACLSRRDRTAESCSTSRAYALTAELARDARAAEMLGAKLIDPALWLCGPDVCPAVIDMTIVYRDDHHLTATMARRLAPLLEPAVLEALR